MLATIGDTLALAVGIAISPIPIIAAILMLLSPHAKQISPAFLIGWVVGVLAVTSIFVALGGAADSSDDESKPVLGIIKLALGALLILLAVKQFRSRPKPGETAEMPSWMNAIDAMPPAKALGMGALLSGVNPKNLLLAASAGVVISGSGLGTAESIVAIIVFAIIASVTVGVPIIGYLLAPERFGHPLEVTRVWLEQNNATVMAVLLFVLGFSVIGKGLGSF